MRSTLDIARSAWTDCVRGDMATCLNHLRSLPALSTIVVDEWRAVEPVLDSLVALLPQRLGAACGLACEAACLELLEKLCAEGALRVPERNAALMAALVHGLGHPLQVDELPAGLVEHARDHARRTDDPDLAPVFHEIYVANSLASCLTALTPPRQPGLPGNLALRVLCTTARARCGLYGDSDSGVWLEQGLGLMRSDAPAAFDQSDAEPRAVTHMHFVALDTMYRLAVLDRDEAALTRSVEGILAIAQQAAQRSLPEEAWCVLGSAARRAGEFPPNASVRPAHRIVEALLQLEQCEHPGVAELQDLMHVAPPLVDHPRLNAQAQRCWDTIRAALGSLAQDMPAASRWRAARTVVSGGITDLPLHSTMDEVRWTDPEQWTRAMLPLFYAHPFEWRDLDSTSTSPATYAKVKAVATCGSRSAWVVNPPEALAPDRFSDDLDLALWRWPEYRGIWHVGPENITGVPVWDMDQLGPAGLFPVVRFFNDRTRRKGADNGQASSNTAAHVDVETVVHLASSKLSAVYEIVREHGRLGVLQDELVCTVGSLCQIPWELNSGKDVRTAHVCLDPTSDGLSAVRIPDIRVTDHSRIGLIGDSSDLGEANTEVDSIVRLFGARAESFPRVDPASFQEAGRRCRILHVAAHGIQAWQDPRTNTIQFAHSTLVARDLACLDLRNVDLVVLNACDAAAPGPSGLAGEASIAGALIAAGTKAVIGALWSVEGSCAATFATTLYTRLASGTPLLHAFHEARGELRSYATALVGENSAFLSDAYRLVLRGRGVANPPTPPFCS
ncbi:CHAT domain-containing protein [Streptomyces sp. NPDC102405]|uniref:CHAT domain-containing protein n=1 Tax=Streptomyces sp. NPDC102405 TaxID=3366170 RepID=UPI0037F5A62D